jgi:transcriptional regulator with XRE-family HTH domain
VIRNQREFTIKRARAERLRKQVTETQRAGVPAKVHPDLHMAAIEAIRAQVRALENEIAGYEALQRGVEHVKITKLAELPEALVKARISRGWTQRELGRRMALAEQQIQRYESRLYRGVPLERLIEVADVLSLEFAGDVTLQPIALEMSPLDADAWRRASLALLLDAVRRETGQPIHGRTQLQKLSLVWGEVVSRQVGMSLFAHRAHDYGPFDDLLRSDLDFLSSQGLVTTGADEAQPKGRLIDRAIRHARVEARDEHYDLTLNGIKWLRRFEASNDLANPEVKRRLEEMAADIARQFGRLSLPELVRWTYEHYPRLAVNSKIRDRVLGKSKVIAKIRRQADA